MPWKSIDDAKNAGAHTELNSVPLTLNQINAIASQADAIDEATGKSFGWATATKDFLETHEIESGKWIEKKSKHSKQLNFEDIDELPTVDIPKVEIFQAGKKTDSDGHTITYTDSDIQQMARDSNAVYLQHEFEGPIKLGHDENQPDPRREDGIPDDGHPAFGWLHNFVCEGGRLFADFKRVPQKLAELIKSGAYAKRSAEIIHNFKTSQGKAYKHVVCGLALLGKTHPALSTLSDITALYKKWTPEEEQKEITHSMNYARRAYEKFIGGTPIDELHISAYSIDVTGKPDGCCGCGNPDCINPNCEGRKKEAENMTPEQLKEAIAKQEEEKKAFEADKKKFEADKCQYEDGKKALMEENKALKAKLKKYEDAEDAEDDKSKCEAEEAEKKKFEAEKAKFEADKKKFEAEKKEKYESDKKAFFSAHSKRFLPADLAAQELLYDKMAEEGKLDEFKSNFAKRPENGIFSEYAAPIKDLADDPGGTEKKKEGEGDDPETISSYGKLDDVEVKAAKYCKLHGLNQENMNDWIQAMGAVGGLKYSKPEPLSK